MPASLPTPSPDTLTATRHARAVLLDLDPKRRLQLDRAGTTIWAAPTGARVGRFRVEEAGATAARVACVAEARERGRVRDGT